jgi:hypothetical protein
VVGEEHDIPKSRPLLDPETLSQTSNPPISLIKKELGLDCSGDGIEDRSEFVPQINE